MDKVILKADGKVYSGWTKVQINRSLTAMAGTFSLAVTWQYKGDATYYDNFVDSLLTGAECTLDIGNDRLITGYLDELTPSYDDQNITVAITGRDKTSDLVDCSVVHSSGRFTSQTFYQIAVTVCEPFGIDVIDETDVEETFERVQVEQGETVSELLTRLSKYCGVLLTTNGLGQLVITRASAERGEIALQLGVNIKAGNGRFSRKQRFSDYIVKVAGGVVDEDADLASIGGVKATINDSEVSCYRPTIIVNDEVSTATDAVLRGKWERQRAISNGSSIEYTLTGWRNTNTGNLIQLNKIVPVKDEIMGIETDMLISNILFSEDNSTGRIVVVSVVNPEALSLPVSSEVTTSVEMGWTQ